MSSADAALAASAARAPAGAARAPGWRLWKTGAVAAALWAGVGGLTLGLPNIEVGFTSWSYTREFGVAALALAALLLLAAVSGREQARPAQALRRAGPWFAALAVAVGGWGAGNRQAGPAAQSLLRTAAIADRGLRLGLQAAPGQPDQFAVAAVQRFRAGRGGGLPDRRGDRLVARAGLLGASGAAFPGTGAVDRALADGVLLLSVRLVGGGVPDRAGDLVPRHRADLVRRGGREPRLLRRGAHHGRQRVVPGAARGHTGGVAAGLRRPVHGAGRVVLGAGGRRNDGREIRPGLVSVLGAGLGVVRQYVRRADRDGAGVLGPDHAAVPGRDRLLAWQKGVVKW